MKIVSITLSLVATTLAAMAQNAISGPMGLYGQSYNAATTIASGGSVLVSTGGNWYLGGNITSADKGNPNTPTATGRTEVITFANTGTYSNAATTAGTSGNVIDGYAATASSISSAFILPLGNATTAYPFTVPASTAVATAYFDGSGSTVSTTVTGKSATAFSPYYDVPGSLSAATYTLSYPGGLTSGTNSVLFSPNGSSYSFGANISPLSTTASTTTASLRAASATRLYLATSLVTLPLTLLSFKGSSTNCNAMLEWQTAGEQNLSGFELDYSNDGNLFTKIAYVLAKNSQSGANYKFTYAQPGDYGFYRLKIIDRDASSAIGNTIAVRTSCGNSFSWSLAPNPVTGGSSIGLNILSDKDQTINATVYTMLGQRVLSQRFSVITGTTTCRMSPQNIAPGAYLIAITDDNGNPIGNVRKLLIGFN